MALFRKKRVPVFGPKNQAEVGPVIGRIDETIRKPERASMTRFLAGARGEEKTRAVVPGPSAARNPGPMAPDFAEY